MPTRLAGLVLSLTALGCVVSVNPLEDADAGVSCPDGGKVGPLGSCIAPCHDTCDPTFNCNCVRGANGCLACEPGGLVDAGADSCQSLPCHDASECCTGMFCLGPEDNTAGIMRCGGPCLPPPAECDDQHPCPGGAPCVEVPAGPCACTPDPGHTCVVPCTPGSCLPMEVCDADGGCRPQRCTEGFQCPPAATCTTDGGDLHGCALKPCVMDPDCGGAVCVNGFCQQTLGQCEFPPP